MTRKIWILLLLAVFYFGFDPMPGGELTAFDAIKTGLDVNNTLTAFCMGEALTLSVNGEALFDLPATDLIGGDFGMAFAPPKAWVRMCILTISSSMRLEHRLLKLNSYERINTNFYEWASSGKDVYCTFDNANCGYAWESAKTLQAFLVGVGD